MLKTTPCAKINLGLYVTERRADGYHNLETVFYPIPLCDELEVELGNGTDEFLCEGLSVAGDPNDNLVMRAVRVLRDKGYVVPPLRIRLTKHIPSGAGLGGGSSDAAFAMRMVNELCDLHLSNEEMEQMLTPLGADCPFFVSAKPVFATGIGNVFTPIDLSLQGLWLLLVKPDDFVSTREAYSHVHPQKPQHDLQKSILRPIEEWAKIIGNDFEESVFPQHPTIADIKQRLYEGGALYAAMSGSGSSVYGIFRHEPSKELQRSFLPHFVFPAQL